MRSREFLPEARSNPQLNPQVSTLDQLELLYQQTKYQGDWVDMTPNLFVSFTSLDKLGVNPSTAYGTPVGIYSYPVQNLLDYHDTAGRDLFQMFATDSPYANIFSVEEEGIYSLDSMSTVWVDEIFRKRLLVLLGGGSRVEDLLERIYQDSPTKSRVKTDGGRFWYVTMKVAEWLDRGRGSDSSKLTKARRWTGLFRRLGMRGFIDPGLGIIHENEPFQAVFFETQSIAKNTRILNRKSIYARRNDSRELRRGLAREQDRLNHARANLNDKDYRNFVIKEVIRFNPSAIRLIKDLDLRLYALQMVPGAYQYVNRIRTEEWEHAIKNPLLLTLIQRIRKPGTATIPRGILQRVMAGGSFNQGLYAQMIDVFTRPEQSFPPGFFADVVRIRPELFLSNFTPAKIINDRVLLLQGYKSAMKKGDHKLADSYAMRIASLNYK